MKTLLLSLGISCIGIFGYSQTVINEVYTDPGTSGNKSEFIELYNSSFATQNLDCFTILTYWESGTDKGWYVLDLPPFVLPSKKWFVIASASPFNVQAATGIVPDLNWNAMPAGAYLKKYLLNGSVYTDVYPGTATDVLMDVAPAGSSGHNYFTFLYQNGVLINGFWGGGANGILPSGIKNMPDLTITSDGACSATYNLNFSGLGAVEFVHQAPGNDNGYARSSDGKCGTWTKTAPGTSHTPGVSNGASAGLNGSLTTAQTLVCNTSPGFAAVNYNITGVTGGATEADDFPVEVQLYYDNGTTPGQLDGADIYQSSLFDTQIADPQQTFSIPAMQYVILVYKTKRGCFDKVVALANGCSPLPVGLVNFTAVRNYNNVHLKWQTTFEQNSQGFAIEKNTGGNWQEVGYVPSQAHNGSSLDDHFYQFSENNTEKGITQYRIREMEQGGRTRYSVIRAVFGMGQVGKTIVFPNPSVDGSVNVLFEDSRSVRNAALIDLNGRIISQWTNITTNNIQIRNLNPGIYSLRIIVPESGDQHVERIVVAKH